MTQQRVRREPPAFRTLSVMRTEAVSGHMTRVILTGDELEGFTVDQPATSLRLLLPTDGVLEIPTWRGNDFRLQSGDSPIIRTFTPRRFDPTSNQLHIDMVLHDGGIASEWIAGARAGDQVAVSGTGRGYEIDIAASEFILLGDETAIPAICQLLEYLPETPIAVHIAIRHMDAAVDLHRDVDVTWHEAPDVEHAESTLTKALRMIELTEGTRIWAAGEAGAMHQIRVHLFQDVDFPRSQATVRGYWKCRVDAGACKI